MDVSEVFKPMFNGDFKEAHSNTINLPEIEPFVFKSFLNYIYADKETLKNLDFKTIKDLYALGDQYLMPQLCNDVISILKRKTNFDYVAVFEVAFHIDNAELMDMCVQKFKTADYKFSPKIFELEPQCFYRLLELAQVKTTYTFELIAAYLKNNEHLTNNELCSLDSDTLLTLVDFNQMTIEEFIAGPGASNLLSGDQKYEILCLKLLKIDLTEKEEKPAEQPANIHKWNSQ